MIILICTDGSQSAEQTANLVACFGLPRDTEITLLGVTDDDSNVADLELSIERMKASLKEALPNTNYLVRQGNPYEQILAEVLGKKYDLVAVGGGGQHHGLIHHKLGSTTSKLARKLHTHFLVARAAPKSLNKVLVCTGAEAPSVETMKVGGKILAGAGANVTLLHVMSQVPIKPDGVPEELQDTAETAMARNTREGQHLKNALLRLQETGIKDKITPRLRHGLVVDEVLAEISEGNYDLLVVGAHYQPGQNRWLGILLDDVTDRLLNQAQCSVLII